jgi:hypothetical protein
MTTTVTTEQRTYWPIMHRLLAAAACICLLVFASCKGKSNQDTVAAQKAAPEVISNDTVQTGNDTLVPIPRPLDNIKAITAGSAHSMALSREGKVFAWGENMHGECNVPEGLGPVKAISAGHGFSAALRTDGTAVMWGITEHHIGLKDSIHIMNRTGWNKSIPHRQHPGMKNYKGPRDKFAKMPITITAYGSSVMLARGVLSKKSLPPGVIAIEEISAGGYHSVLRMANGSVMAIGFDCTPECAQSRGGPSNGGWDNCDFKDAVHVGAGGAQSAVLHRVGNLSVWGDRLVGCAEVPARVTGVKAISLGLFHVVGLNSDGTVAVWQAAGKGTDNTDPPPLTGVTKVAAGAAHSLALLSNGTVVAWGNNEFGQCDVPAKLSGVADIAAGGGHSMALLASGRVVCWGECNSVGFQPD